MGSVGAELAFTTDSNYRGGGIATLILRHLDESLGGWGIAVRGGFSRGKSAWCLLSFGTAAWQCNFAGDDGVLRFRFNRISRPDGRCASASAAGRFRHRGTRTMSVHGT